ITQPTTALNAERVQTNKKLPNACTVASIYSCPVTTTKNRRHGAYRSDCAARLLDYSFLPSVGRCLPDIPLRDISTAHHGLCYVARIFPQRSVLQRRALH